jgi:hypothetical protein
LSGRRDIPASLFQHCDEGRRVTALNMTNIKISSKTNCRHLRPFAAAPAALPLVHAGCGRGAGKVSIASLDHRVATDSAAMQKQARAPAAKDQLELQADFITAGRFQGAKALTAALPAPPEIAVQIHDRSPRLRKPTSGRSTDRAIALADDQLEGFAR